MKRALLAAMTIIAGSLFVAGCGSSSSKPSSPSSSPASKGGGAASASGGAAAKVTTKHSKLGTILAAGRQDLTVYLFERDKGSKSSCMGACAAVWPPVTTSGSPAALGKAMSVDIGTTMRPDGIAQVTYKGHPLYYFHRDKDHGDSYGEGIRSFGASWYALTPSGKKVDNS